MNDREQAASSSAGTEADLIARQRRIGRALWLWKLILLFLIATVTTSDFSPYVVWKLPAHARMGLALVAVILAVAAALASKAAAKR